MRYRERDWECDRERDGESDRERDEDKAPQPRGKGRTIYFLVFIKKDVFLPKKDVFWEKNPMRFL